MYLVAAVAAPGAETVTNFELYRRADSLKMQSSTESKMSEFATHCILLKSYLITFPLMFFIFMTFVNPRLFFDIVILLLCVNLSKR
jgi:hypothetical protein